MARKPVSREVQRNRTIKFMHGITLKQYEEKLADQNYECAICGTFLCWQGGINTHLDHNHETGKLRDFLCGPCNRGLGHFADDIKRIEGALLYLEKHARAA